MRAECPHDVVLVSPTCDVALPNRLAVQVARRVRPSRDAAEAQDGYRPRHVQLPEVGPWRRWRGGEATGRLNRSLRGR